MAAGITKMEKEHSWVEMAESKVTGSEPSKLSEKFYFGFKIMMSAIFLSVLCVVALARSHPDSRSTHPICVVRPNINGDSGPAIEDAFNTCGHNPNGRGKVIFLNETYTIGSVMNTTYLQNVDIDLRGTLEWNNSDIHYWLNNSLPVGYQNQSSAWLFGGSSIHWKGHGYGTFNGNGQVWYDFVNGASNYPRRPHQITIRNTTNSVFEGINFWRSQMWTMAIISSQNVTLQDIYVNNTSLNGQAALNTDGADTIYSNNITFRRWTVDNGDDAISPKANSTNILIEDSIFYTGSGIALGSIGQDDGVFERIVNITARNITTYGTKYGAYIKTWTGIPKGYPPNGGGGGIGYISGVHLNDFMLHDNQNTFAITQCTSYNGETGDCDTSKFNINNVYLSNWTGTDRSDARVALQCSASSPCYNIGIEDMNIVDAVNGTTPKYNCCDSVEDTFGFNCTAPIWGDNDAF